ncbi:MAG: aminotransferase class V-fold PLP-dependent enzyme [Defluviitaleaceae bacterium]|nr:aminotransferase class V-fold PLP-dependent enzyme [Defluviitaleaceae bacterium]
MPLYFDNAATTPLHPQALAAMLPYLSNNFANPSSVYTPARAARKAIDQARQTVANAIGAKPVQIFFTGSGTEAVNWAIKGVLEARRNHGRHVITTAIEHHAALYTCKHLEKLGYEITYLPVDNEGFVSPEAVSAAIRPDTVLASVILANNEVGTIQPMAAIGEITRKAGIVLHTDAVQAVGHIPIDVEALNIDILSLSAHKFSGPKGIGAQYIRTATPIAPLLIGGAQERGRRAGTENVAGIVGLAEALSVSMGEMAEQRRLSALRDRLINEILTRIPHTRLNGPRDNRLPGNVNISFSFIEGESLLLHLDMLGCQASTGSACSSGALEPSHVLTAMGLSHELANGTIRFSLGRESTLDDIDGLMVILEKSVARLRELSPLYDDFLRREGASV